MAKNAHTICFGRFQDHCHSGARQARAGVVTSRDVLTSSPGNARAMSYARQRTRDVARSGVRTLAPTCTPAGPPLMDGNLVADGRGINAPWHVAGNSGLQRS